jgi:AcrR family transcriptional regulator
MSGTPAPASPPHSRGRRTARPSGDDRELAILATAEKLLRERPLGEISIGDLAEGAGISRPTFYFYFRSKDAVLLTLLDKVVTEADAAAEAAFDPTDADPARQWRHAIDAYFQTFRAHRAVTLAGAQLRASNPEVQQLWATVLRHWVQRTTEAIEFERERGTAPPGLPAADLATALNLMNERAMYATFAGERPALPESDVVDVLLRIWLSSIYQSGGSAPQQPPELQ